MNVSLQQATTYFQTYEDREEAFRRSVYSLIPRKYCGPKLFWNDFSSVSLEELLTFSKRRIAYITSNPRDGLAFGTPWQVLSAAVLCAQSADQDVPISTEDIAADFDLGENLKQPIRTLSGGETVKLALAKAAAASNFCEHLIIASPFSWLSRENTNYFDKLLDIYRRSNIPVDLFALAGEDSNEPVEPAWWRKTFAADPIGFSLHLKDVHIPLGTTLNPIQSRESFAQIDAFSAALCSPCLIVGDNGQGKSLLAKVLTGAISFTGDAEIRNESNSGPVRLLFQDVISQTLLRSFDAIAKSLPTNNGSNPIELYQRLLTEYLLNLANLNGSSAAPKRYANNGHRTLLEIKTILVAVRLCGAPRALILDEPDWGLTRKAAIAFVAAIIKVAHELGIPVILISHKPWWSPIAGSTVCVGRTPKQVNRAGAYTFKIKLQINDPP
jgi:energy-coupling factor transporter ATP-binding protein EcfA2